MSTEETALRLAEIVSAVMNLNALVHDEATLASIDPAELRSEFLSLADELIWLGSVVASGTTAGISWPSDAGQRIERLRALARGWDSAGPPPAEVVSAAQECLAIVQPDPRASGDA